MNLAVSLRAFATSSLVVALALAPLAAQPAAAADRPYDVGISYDVTPPYSDRLCPIHIRFLAEVSAKLAPGVSREITYHWESGKGKIYPDHTLTIPPDMNFSVPTYAPGQPHPVDVSTPIPRGRSEASKGLSFNMTHSFSDHVLFVITSPVHEVVDSNHLDILCR